MKIYRWFGMACGSFLIVAASAQTMVESFEYTTDDELLAAWRPSGNAQLTVSDSIAPRATSKKSMRIDFSFPSIAWATETVHGPTLETPISIDPSQYVTFRLRGDPAFNTADFRNIYLYVYDADGNFGRWGSQVPVVDEWQIMNFAATPMQQPWNSPGLPDLSQIVQFAFFQYGSEAAIDPYTATIYIDDLTVRDTPLVEFGPPSAPRALIDDFEGYADDAAMRTFYSYQNSPAATATTASVATPAPQGNKALKLAIDFAPGQWPWGSVRSAVVTPFSLPTNAVVTMRLKGDPILETLADAGTTFWLSFYDKAGRGINYITPAAPVISSEWTTLEARFENFNNTSTVDTGNLVQWRILVEGWQGTAESAALSGAFYVDDIRVTIPSAERPSLTLVREARSFKLNLDQLAPRTSYELRQTADFVQWSTATTINATATTATWNIPNDQPKAFFQLIQR